MKRKTTGIILWIVCVAAAVVLIIGGALWIHHSVQPEQQVVTPDDAQVSGKDQDADFSGLFTKTMRQGQSIIVATVQEMKAEDQLVEYYQTDLTTYTRYTVNVERNLTGRFSQKEITVYVLGDSDSFPDREQLILHQTYVLRLQPWVVDGQVVYLMPPTDTTYYRVIDGAVLRHENPKSANYTEMMSLSAFEDAFAAFCEAQKMQVTPESFLDEFQNMQSVLTSYNYNDENLSYRPDQKQRDKTRSAVADIISKMSAIVRQYQQGDLSQAQALDALRACV